MSPQIAFLRAHGVDTMGHTDDGLLAHLQGTRDLLIGWGAPAHVCTAGLFHSVYGTESYRARAVPPELRPKVQALIGERSEWVVHCFGAMEKPSFYANLEHEGPPSLLHRTTAERIDLERSTLHDLYNLTVANWLEQRPRTAPEHRFIRRDEFSRMRPHLLPGARAALERAYGFDP